MMLYVNGEDIDRLVLALVNRTNDVFAFVREPESFAVSHDAFLKTVVEYLEREQITMSALTGIIVASGQGSSTALRSTHAFTNAWSFALHIPLFSVHKSQETADADILRFIDSTEHTFLRPAYGQGPKITLSTKDALRR